MSLLENIKKMQNLTYTENGAIATSSTGNYLLDLFAISGSLRTRNNNDIANMFIKAMVEDKLLATKLAFYTRDIREGLGKRDSAKVMFKVLGEIYPDIMKMNLHLLKEYGRFDDLLCLLDTKVKDDVIILIKEQLKNDLENMSSGKPISLLAKWLPSVNTSSYKTRLLARLICKELSLSEKEYRKILSTLRAYLNVTEVRMSNKSYSQIKYDNVPSYAMQRYSDAFIKHDKERFNKYLDSLKKGEAKINSSVLYPYDIIEKILFCDSSNEKYKILEEEWNNLPNYVEGENNFLIMADVSGSMYGRPLATSVGLSIYFAQKNKGAFANKFMTFSSVPELVEIKGDTLLEKINYIKSANWDMNTNLEAAFNLVLNTAIDNRVKKEEMPTSIVVISDMEIDSCSDVNNWTFYDLMKKRFNDNGYEIPNIVFWNVDARQNTFHAYAFAKGVQLASGQSPAVFKSLIKAEYMTPYEYMLSVLNTPRYEQINVQS